MLHANLRQQPGPEQQDCHALSDGYADVESPECQELQGVHPNYVVHGSHFRWKEFCIAIGPEIPFSVIITVSIM